MKVNVNGIKYVPLLTSSLPVSLPMPELAPVTMTVFPFIDSLLWHSAPLK